MKQEEIKSAFKLEAKMIVDALFESKVFRENITRDDMNETENVIVRLNSLTQRVHEAVTEMDNALDLKDANEKVAELTELVHDQDEELVMLRAVCIQHGWNPESQTGCASEIE